MKLWWITKKFVGGFRLGVNTLNMRRKIFLRHILPCSVVVSPNLHFWSYAFTLCCFPGAMGLGKQQILRNKGFLALF